MTSRQSRRHRRALSIDFLESRALLSATHPWAPTAEVRADASGRSVHLALKGSERYSYDGTTLISRIDAGGHAPGRGQVHLQATYSVDNLGFYAAVHADGAPISRGTATLADSHGGQIHLSFGGYAGFSRGPILEIEGVFTGESGRFAGVTGTVKGIERHPIGTRPLARGIRLTLTPDR